MLVSWNATTILGPASLTNLMCNLLIYMSTCIVYNLLDAEVFDLKTSTVKVREDCYRTYIEFNSEVEESK